MMTMHCWSGSTCAVRRGNLVINGISHADFTLRIVAISFRRYVQPPTEGLNRGFNKIFGAIAIRVSKTLRIPIQAYSQNLLASIATD